MSKIKRMIVLLLAVAMLITGSGFTVLAESLNSEAEPAVTEAQAEDKDQQKAEPVAKADDDAKVEEKAKAEAKDSKANEAKAETKADWEKTIPSDLPADVREAVVEVAKSQLKAAGSRYTTFTKADSEDWDASFVMFVLNYAEVKTLKKAEDIHFDADTAKWMKALDKADMLQEIAEATEDSEAVKPEEGDIVFIGKKADDAEAAVVIDADDDKLMVIGAEKDAVSKFEAEDVLGFVSLKTIVPDEFAEEAEENTEEATTEDEAAAEDAEAVEDKEELTEEELTAKKAEEEAAAKAEAEAAAIEADKKAQAEEEAAKAEEAARRIKAEKLVDKQIGAELTSAPGFGSKLKSIFTSDKGTEITLNGYLPEGATVKAYPVTVEIPGQKVLAAYDITIYVKDESGKDVEWQPAEPLNVSIKTNKLAKAAEKADSNVSFNVFHMENKDAYPIMVENIDLGDGEASFKADRFSIYAIGEEDTSKHVIYNFWWDVNDINDSSKQPYKSIALKDKDKLLAPADPLDTSRGKFLGWFTTNEGGTEEAFSCADEPAASIEEDAEEDIVKNIYAKFDGAQYATFQSLYIDMHRTVFHTEKLTQTGNTYSLDLNNVPTYGAPVGYKFLGWTLTQPTDTHGYGENIPKTGEGRYYAPNETITGLTGSVTLYPVVKKMHTVSLDGNGGTVKDLPVYKIQMTKDDNLAEVISGITDVERSGYSRDGDDWFDAAEGGNAVEFGSVVLSEDKTYYAHWTATTTKVTVKYWKQAVNANDPYAFIDEDTFTVKTGTTVELGKQNGSDPSNVSREDVLFHDPSDSANDQSLDIIEVISRVQTGGDKLGTAGGNYKKDTELKYFHSDNITSADPSGNVHTSNPYATYGRSFTVAEDGSTVVNVWIDRTTYYVNFTFYEQRALASTTAYANNTGGDGGSLIDKKYPNANGNNVVNLNGTRYYKIRLGESLNGIWPNHTASELQDDSIGSAGFSVVALGLRSSSTNKYPEAVTSKFVTPLSYVTPDLLDLEKDSTSHQINLWGRYNNNTFHGGLTDATIKEHYETSTGGETTREISLKYGKGDRDNAPVPVNTYAYPGYYLDVSRTISQNGGANYVTENPDGTVSIHFRKNGAYNGTLYNNNYKRDVYYKLNTYTVNLRHGDNVLAQDDDVKYTEPIKTHLENTNNGTIAHNNAKAVYNNPTAAAGLPAYMVWDGKWYTDLEHDVRYVLNAQTMPASSANIFAKFSPIPVTVKVDNGIKREDGSDGITVDDPALNLSGSEMGGSIEHLNYEHEYGTTTDYVAHEHTIAEYLPTYWVNPVWENHVFTGWKYRVKDADGNWGAWHSLVDINIPVDSDVELKATWQDMTRHSIHYFERDKEVYLDPEAYVEGKTVVIKGTTTEIYENNTTSVFQHWKDSDGTIYKPGQEITMGDKDITLEAVFAPGGTNSGSEKATYTFKVENDGNWEDYYEEIVYRGERLSPPPKAPTHGTDVFEGWYLDRNLTQRFDGFGTVSAPVNTTLYASFKRPWRVTYRGYAADGEGELITVQTYPYTGTDNLNTMGVGQYYTYQTDSALYALVGWSDIKVTPGSTPDDDHYFSGYTDHKVNGDMTLYPVLEDGFWLTYYHDENMVTIPDVYYGHSQNLNFKWPDPDDVKRTDYDFTGKWYTDPECQTEFNWNSTLEHNTTIYAGWKPKPEMKSQYTVVWWVEKADSNGNADDKSNYVYSNSVTVGDQSLDEVIPDTVQVTTSHASNTAANTVTHADLVYSNGNNYSQYFAVNNTLSDASVTVVRDGSATLNIYVQRKRYTMQFNLNGNGTIKYDNTNFSSSWTEPVWFEMPWGGKWPILDGDEDQGYGSTMPKLTMGSGKTYDTWAMTGTSNATTTPVVLDADTMRAVSGTTITATLQATSALPYTTYVEYRFRDNSSSDYTDTTYYGGYYDVNFQTILAYQTMGAKGILGYDDSSASAYKNELVYTPKSNYQYAYVGSNTAAHRVAFRGKDSGNLADKRTIEIYYTESGNIYTGTGDVYLMGTDGWSTRITRNADYLRYYYTVNSDNSVSLNSNITNYFDVSGSYTYTFYYTRQTKNIHLHGADGNEISQSPITLMVGQSLAGQIGDPSAYGINPPEEGKVFAGWSRSEDSLVGVYDSNDTTATMPLYDIHYYLHWADKMVTVTVVDEDGNTIQEYGPMVYDTKLSEFGLQDDPPENHKFTGWQIYETEEDISLSTKIKDNIKVKGNYVDLRAKSLYYDLNGGKLKDTEEDTEEDPLIPGTTLETSGTHKDQYVDNDHYMVGASVPVKNIVASKLKFFDGYVDFAYWNTEKKGTGDIYYPNDAIEIPNGKDMVLYAIYSPDLTTKLVYDLNYDDQPTQKSVIFRDYRTTQHLKDGELKVNDPYKAGTEYDSASKTYKPLSYGTGTAAKAVDKMRPGYKFLGWAESADAKVAKYKDGADIRVTSYDNSNHHVPEQTLYAVWEPVKLPVEVYEISDDNPNGVEKAVSDGKNPFLIIDNITAAIDTAQSDSAAAVAYDANDRNAIPTTDAFGKATQGAEVTDDEEEPATGDDPSTGDDPGTAEAPNVDDLQAITFIRFNSDDQVWEYATEETAPEGDDGWTPFGARKLRLYYHPNPRDVKVYFVAKDEGGTLTSIINSTTVSIGKDLFTIDSKATGDNTLKINDVVTVSDKRYVLQDISTGPEYKATGEGATTANDLSTAETKKLYLKNMLKAVNYSKAVSGSNLQNPTAMTKAKPALYIVYKEKTFGELTVTKTVTGDYGNKTKEFDFTVSGLSAGEEYSFQKYEKGSSGSYTAMTGTGTSGDSTADSNGKLTFKLKNNQKIVLTMRLGSTLDVAETAVDNYKTNWSIDGGSVTEASSVEVSFEDDTTVACENDYVDSSIVPSGINKSNSILIPLFIAMLLAFGLVMSIRRRRRMGVR